MAAVSHSTHMTLMAAGAIGIASTFVSKGNKVAGIEKSSLTFLSLASLAIGFYLHHKMAKEPVQPEAPLTEVINPPDDIPYNPAIQTSGPNSYTLPWPHDAAAWSPGVPNKENFPTNTVPYNSLGVNPKSSVSYSAFSPDTPYPLVGAGHTMPDGSTHYPEMDDIYPHVPEFEEEDFEDPLLDAVT